MIASAKLVSIYFHNFYIYHIRDEILLKIQDITILQQKTSLYCEDNEFCNKLIENLNNISKDRRLALLKYIAIIVLSHYKNDRLILLEKIIYNKQNIIKKIKIESNCNMLVAKAEQFIQEIAVGN